MDYKNKINDNIISTDVLIIGGGPAGLSTAISLANKFKKKKLNKRIILLEKGVNIGSHILSGAVIRPNVFKELLNTSEYNDLPFDCKVTKDKILKLNEYSSMSLPFHPPYMSNDGNYIASLGEICKYLSTLAIKKGVEIYSSFAADSILYKDNKVIGVKTKDTGVNHNGEKQKNFQEGSSVIANITILAEGSRGSLTKELIKKLNLDSNKEAQIYSLGIKELWQMPKDSVDEGSVIHTFGYPLKDKEEFGGGFIYGLKNDKLAIGLAVGLDYADPSFDIHAAMQIWKTHPDIKKLLNGGKLLEFGAKTLPEGGYNSIPKYYDHNVLIVGDSAGFLSTARLKGIHLAVRSGICAADASIKALEKNDTSNDSLKYYEELINNSFIYKELYPTRNFRAVMKDGMIVGGFKTAIQLLTNGACMFIPNKKDDYKHTLKSKNFKNSNKKTFKERFINKLDFDKILTFDKVTSVYFSNTTHDEVQVPHLHIKDNNKFQDENIEQYNLSCESFCPAEVYELHTNMNGEKRLRLHFENCVHCKTCDIKEPNSAITWTTPYGGDGPDYNYM